MRGTTSSQLNGSLTYGPDALGIIEESRASTFLMPAPLCSASEVSQDEQVEELRVDREVSVINSIIEAFASMVRHNSISTKIEEEAEAGVAELQARVVELEECNAALILKLQGTIQKLEDANTSLQKANEEAVTVKADKEIAINNLVRTQAKVEDAEAKVAELEAELNKFKLEGGKAEAELVGAENAVLIQGEEGGAERAAEGAAQGAKIEGDEPHRDQSIDPPPSDIGSGREDLIEKQRKALENFRLSRLGLKSEAAETSGSNEPKKGFLADLSRKELLESMKDLEMWSAGSSENKGEKPLSGLRNLGNKTSVSDSWVAKQYPALQEGAAGRGI